MSTKWLRQRVDPRVFTGNFVAADLATASAPIIIPGTDTNVQLTNDGSDASTTALNAPLGLAPLWNVVTDQFDFSDLSIGDQMLLCITIEVTTVTPNTDTHLSVALGIGTIPRTLVIANNTYKAAAPHTISVATFVTMDNLDTLNGKAEIHFRADGVSTVEVLFWNYIVNLRTLT